MILIIGPRLRMVEGDRDYMHKMVTEMGNGSQLPMLAIEEWV